LVSKHTGRNTGEWMQGGEIQVDGQIQSIGKNLFAGRIYKQGRLIAPETHDGNL
jgi:formylmethanofuran dehydrogenase subunit C